MGPTLHPGARLPGSILALLLTLAAGAARADCATFEIVGDGIPLPLSQQTADADAGRQAAADRQRGDCSICHQLPLPNARFHGNVGPDLSAIGARLTPPQIRLRVAANRHLNPESVMPDYGISRDRHQVAEAFAGQPILTAREIEDIVAWLASLDGSEP
ncbi:MAG: sulfur oxidation c-type cytochrome SoxX [Gammaproteobacteria bacterium]|nr:sulfur oxidation c-type cytochrome SoxX [Gammaproteobacteria bacterium]